MSSQYSSQVKYSINKKGYFIIENYNKSKTFSNFFPGIAGLWGIPMWVFYVNRGQCITSFGIEAKDKAIMEFQPANKSYRLTSLQGFRTFIKVKTGKKQIYWEPFQNYLMGTTFKKKQTLTISSHDLTLEEINDDLGLAIKVNYFTLPQEPYSALVRRITIHNLKKTSNNIEMVDGLPVIVPYGLNDWLNKNLSRTVEAWVKVRNLENKAPYYQLNVEVSDKPQVTHIEEGNFFFSFDPSYEKKMLMPIVDASYVFGQSQDFITAERFLEGSLDLYQDQQTSNRTPSAMGYSKILIAPKEKREIVSLFGYSYEVKQLNEILEIATNIEFINKKEQENKEIIDEIKNNAFTKSSSSEFDLYTQSTFLDNILRGGLPISLPTNDGDVILNVFSRKHGDLERDYNYFTVAPTFFSQGNGNFRDVNQNRRCDVWFNKDVKDNHLINFLNLIQADGYNPLIVKGMTFKIKDAQKIEEIVNKYTEGEGQKLLVDLLKEGFLPGYLLELATQNGIKLKIDPKEFLKIVLARCEKKEEAAHGEGYWTDHWTYNTDLVETYLSLYPENLKNLLLDKKQFSFYHNNHFVLPREQRYILTDKGVRQYASVFNGENEIKVKDNVLKTKNGEGGTYYTNLITKSICIIANKIASLDPSNIGVEMEADKPSWYDALNGLPGLLGSSISETMETERLSSFVLESIKKLSLNDDYKVLMFEELATFFSGLSNILSLEKNAYSYWIKANDIKEHYRQKIRQGINGEEKEVSVGEIRNFLSLVINKSKQAQELALDDNGNLLTYFYHEVTDYEKLDKNKNDNKCYVRPTKFKRHNLSLFLEGYVHAFRVADKKRSFELYKQLVHSDLYDKKLKMFKVNADLTSLSEEIGRARVFPRGWLENESIWLHMEYKILLELLKNEMYEEFYHNFKNLLVPFFKPSTYGRSIFENSSFIVSSAHEDASLHGQGFVARLSGSTAEIIHIWLMMNMGIKPFTLDVNNEPVLTFSPVLAEWLFTKKESTIECVNLAKECQNITLPKDIYSFVLFGTTLVVYHNPKRLDTFGNKKGVVKKYQLTYPEKKSPVIINTEYIPTPYSKDIRDKKVERIDIYLG